MCRSPVDLLYQPGQAPPRIPQRWATGRTGKPGELCDRIRGRQVAPPPVTATTADVPQAVAEHALLRKQLA